jgi:hypothetical protein
MHVLPRFYALFAVFCRASRLAAQRWLRGEPDALEDDFL